MNTYDQSDPRVGCSARHDQLARRQKAVAAPLSSWTAFAIAALVMVAAGCDKSPSEKAKKDEPAHVAQHIEEAALNTITLSPEAEQRLGIVLVEAGIESLPRHRMIGGEVVLPPGQLVTITAPLVGTLAAPAGRPPLVPGQHVAAGEPLFDFKPLLTPERDVLTPAERVRVAQTRADIATAQMEANRQVETAEVAVEAAQIAYDRAVQLLKIKAGSQRSVDEAAAALKLAQESLKTARERYKFLSAIQLDEQPGHLHPQLITSPVDGVLQDISSAIGETVSPGDALVSVMQTDHVWIRVPVFVGDSRVVDKSQPADVSEYGEQLSGGSRPARYVKAPPTADALAATVDIYYQLENEDAQLYPGQLMEVSVPLQTQSESLTVPFAAVLYDINGGAWVYEQVAERVYARRRVAIDYVAGEKAVLVTGPDPGAKVVTDGAAELMGTEFGVGH